jgi:hypothetical protein
MYPGIGSPGTHDFHCAAQKLSQTILKDLLNRKIGRLSLPAVVVLSKKGASKKITHGFLWDKSQRYKVGGCVLNVFTCEGVAAVYGNLIMGRGYYPLHLIFSELPIESTPCPKPRTPYLLFMRTNSAMVFEISN